LRRGLAAGMPESTTALFMNDDTVISYFVDTGGSVQENDPGRSSQHLIGMPESNMVKIMNRTQQHALVWHRGYGVIVPLVLSAMLALGGCAEGEEAESTVPSKRSALRSTREVFGYDVQAEDGDVGSVADFLVDDKSWNIRYLVVDTAQWLSRDKVLIAPDWVTEVDWALREVQVGLTREEVENAPSFDQSEPIERSYEVRLYDYYGRPKYWEQA